MHAALPRSEYYDGAAPPAPSAGVAPIRTWFPLAEEKARNGRGWFPRSLLSGQRVRHPALPLRYRHGYAVGTSPWPPSPGFGNPAWSSPSVMRDRCAPLTNPYPPDWSWRPIKRRNATGFFSYTFPSRSPRPAHPAVLNRRDFVKAAPTLPGDPRIRLPSASPRRYDGREMGSLTSIRKQQHLVAHPKMGQSR